MANFITFEKIVRFMGISHTCILIWCRNNNGCYDFIFARFAPMFEITQAIKAAFSNKKNCGSKKRTERWNVNWIKGEPLTLKPPNYSIWIFTHFKWVKIIQIWQNGGQFVSNLAGWCHILSLTYLKCGTLCANKKWKPEYMRHRRLKG